MGLRPIPLTFPHPWMKARSRGSGTSRSSDTGSSEGSLVRELSYQSPIQIWAGSPSKATGHISGSTNRFPSQLPRYAAGMGPVSALPCPRTPRRARPRGATLKGAGVTTAAASLCPSPGDTGSLRPDEGGRARVGLLLSPSA